MTAIGVAGLVTVVVGIYNLGRSNERIASDIAGLKADVQSLTDWKNAITSPYPSVLDRRGKGRA